MKKSENKPIFIDVKFEETLSKENCLFIMLELVKNLIYQRRQIPLTFDTLNREIRKYYTILANVWFSKLILVHLMKQEKLNLQKNSPKKPSKSMALLDLSF